MHVTQMETTIRTYFAMWVERDFTHLDDLFAADIYYSECYGPEYCGMGEMRQWIAEMLRKQKVLAWSIKRFIYEEDTAVVEWSFSEEMNGREHSFDGVSIIEFGADETIVSIKEFESKAEHTAPYRANPSH